jgi:hypothetical protein
MLSSFGSLLRPYLTSETLFYGNVRAHSRCVAFWRSKCAKPSSWPPAWLSSGHQHGARAHREMMTIGAGGGRTAVTDGRGTGIEATIGGIGADVLCATMTTIGSAGTLISSCAVAIPSFALSVGIENPPKPALMRPCACLIGCSRNLAQRPIHRHPHQHPLQHPNNAIRSAVDTLPPAIER